MWLCVNLSKSTCSFKRIPWSLIKKISSTVVLEWERHVGARRAMPPLVKWHHKGIWLLRSDLRLVTLQIPGLLLLLSLKRENIWMHKRLKYQNTSYLPWVCLCILEKLKSFHIAVFFSVIGKIDPKGMPCELSTVKCVPQRSWKARD